MIHVTMNEKLPFFSEVVFQNSLLRISVRTKLTGLWTVVYYKYKHRVGSCSCWLSLSYEDISEINGSKPQEALLCWYGQDFWTNIEFATFVSVVINVVAELASASINYPLLGKNQSIQKIFQNIVQLKLIELNFSVKFSEKLRSMVYLLRKSCSTVQYSTYSTVTCLVGYVIKSVWLTFKRKMLYQR